MESRLRFTPSAVRGLRNVTEVNFSTQRLELVSNHNVVVIRYLDIAKWYCRWGKVYRSLARVGGPILGRPYIADRDWFHPPAKRFFRFYTSRPITIFMPDESRELPYEETMFRRVQNIIQCGGVLTYDLG